MTPAINCVKKAKIKFNVHTYEHNPSSDSYGKEAAEKLTVSVDRVFKTLVVSAGKELAVVVVPVSQKLNLKSAALALGVKKTAMADTKKAERSTGYILGGISPLGQKKKLKTMIDESALAYETIYVSAGKRGLEIELSPEDLSSLTQAAFVRIAS